VTLVHSSDIYDRTDYELYNGADIAASANDLVISDIASADYSILNIIFTGDGDGEFTVLRNSTEIFRIRNSWSTKGQPIPMDGLKISSGDTIEIYCENKGSVTNHYTARVNGKIR
jgi:hypothetical protein